MGKVLQPLMVVAAIAVNIIPGVGQVLSAAMISAITVAGVTAALGMAAGFLGLGPKPPKISDANNMRLNSGVDVTTPRKIIFGETCMACDVRYQEWDDIDDYEQGRLHRIYFQASHKVYSIDELWLDDRLAWTKTGGVQSFYIDSEGSHTGPYLYVETREEGAAGNTISMPNSSGNWDTTMRCTGLAYSYVRFRVIGQNVEDKPFDGPFSSGIPTRMTFKGRGAFVYDPRQDSTVGGSGTMRANDQSTWAYTGGYGDIGRNPALQILWYLLGWKINGKLALGRGVPPSRIDMASFITAANICDEIVTSSVFGSEPRYRSDGIFSEGDDPGMVLETLKAACNGDLRDFGGIFALHIKRNDLATVSVQLSQDDLLGGFLWKQTADIDETFNEVRGRFVDPSDLSLFQLRDYPAVRLTPVDGIERAYQLDLATVQSVSQCQRIAKMRLARNLYRGTFAGDFNARAWKTGVGKIVELSMSPLGWANKKFRVLEMGVRVDGVVPLLLQEENSDIYLWDNSDTPAVQPFDPIHYDPSLAPIRRQLEGTVPGATRNVWRGDWSAPTQYYAGDLVFYQGVVYEALDDHISVVGQPPPNSHWQMWFATGQMDGVWAGITRSEFTVHSSWDGVVPASEYIGCGGKWEIYAGTTDITAQFLPIVTIANLGTLDVSYNAENYAVTGSFDPEDDFADLVMQVNGTGQFAALTFERTFRLSKIRASYPLDTDPPAMPTGLNLGSSITQNPDGSQVTTLSAQWNANGEADLAYYRLFVRVAGGNFIEYWVGGTQWSAPALPGVTYEAKLAAVDLSGNVSVHTSIVQHTVTGDTVAPGLPTGFTAAAAFETVFLNWVAPSDYDLSAIEVWENTSNDSGTATRIATVAAEAGKAGTYSRSLATGLTRYYWLKAVDTSGNASAFTAGSGAVTTATLDAGTQILPGSITTPLITANTLNGDRLLAGSVYANKLTVSGNATQDALPTGITIGVSGTTIGNVDLRAADPIARANTQTTLLAPGLVLISGSTTLASWRFGGDQTKIDGGNIAANTISANKISIGSRGIIIEGIEFEHNAPASNRVSWTAGTISYTDDDGSNVSLSITAGDATAWASGTQYFYWVKGSTSILMTADLATANAANNVVLATYRGGANLVATYGRTIIDGSDIKTGTITGDRLAANTITSAYLATSVLISQSSQLGSAVVTSLKIAGATIIVPHVTEGSDTFISDSGTEVDVLTSSTVTVGDSTYGAALITIQGDWDGTVQIDAYVDVFLDVSVNSGSYVREAQCRMGCRTSGGNSYPFIPFSMSYIVGGASPDAAQTVACKLRAISVEDGGTTLGRQQSYLRQPKIVIQGGKR